MFSLLTSSYRTIFKKEKSTMFKSYGKKRRIRLILTFAAYICCALFVIVEACLPGKISANQSNTVGGGIADIINGNAEDQTVIIPPASLEITNKNIADLTVGDTYQLETKILPENCSFESLSYQSNNPQCVDVDEKGKITAKKEGQGTITCYSTSYPDIKDSFSLTIHNIKETKITSTIENATLGNDGIYDLECNRTYTIKTVFTPNNTTDKKLTYQSDCTDNSIAISEGVIRTNSITEKPLTITITSVQGLTNTIKVKVHENQVNIIPLTKISISKADYVQSVGESVAIGSKKPYQVTFEPSNATYKTFTIEVSDPTIASVSGTKITGKKNGTTELTISSVKYPELKDTRIIQIDMVRLSLIKSIYLNHSSAPIRNIGATGTLSYQGASPSNASAVRGKKADHISYQSLDSTIASVNATGKVKALKEGTTTINRLFYNTKEDKDNHSTPAVTKSIKVKVNAQTLSEIKDFSLKNNLSESDNDALVLYSNKSYNLTSGIRVDKLYDKNGKEITDTESKALSFAIDSAYPEEEKKNRKLTNGIFIATSSSPCRVTFKVTHESSKVSKYISYIIFNDRTIKDSLSGLVSEDKTYDTFEGASYPTFSQKVSLSVSDRDTLTIDSADEITYQFTLETKENTLCSLLSHTSDSITIKGRDEGERKVLITPCFQGHVYTGNSKILRVSIRHRYLKSLSLKLYDTSQKEISLPSQKEGEVSLTRIKGEKVTYKLIRNPKDYTIENIQITNSDPNSITVKGSTITGKNIGKSSITFLDSASMCKVTLSLSIVNKTEFTSTPFTLSQSHLSYDKEKNIYHIENGTTAKIKTNFVKGSTYKKVQYTSSDKDILQVGNDGKITPLKAGEATITALVDDQNTIHLAYKVNIIVDKKGVIRNRRDFFLKVRKMIGHFGAFLITGICSTLFYLLLVKEKKQHLIFVPVNFVQGFLLAGLTELIQLFVPGRSGLFSDVRIDYIGFLFSAVTITLLYFLIPLIIKGVKILLEKHKEKKAEK